MTLVVSALDNVGVEVSGFDITQPIDEELAAELVSLWDEHGILFPDTTLHFHVEPFSGANMEPRLIV
jgi:hypothetical protein